MPAGNYDILVNVNGTPSTVIDLSDTDLNAGEIYTVIAINDVGSIEPLLVIDPDGTVLRPLAP